MAVLHTTTERVLKAIYQYQSENKNWYPTVRDIQDITGISSTSVVGLHIEHLKKRGYIENRSNRSCSRITPMGLYYLQRNKLIPQQSKMPSQFTAFG